MPSFKCAHVREQGVELIIVPVSSTFGDESPSNQQELVDAMQLAASSAGLAGRVVPVWRVDDRMMLIAPPAWHSFFQSIHWNQIQASVNKEVSW